MTVYLLPQEPFFPPVAEAEPDGLIAIGGDLSAKRLVQAYAQGIFPWFVEEDDFYWYSPDPRLVLLPKAFKASGTLQRLVKKKIFEIRVDTNFEGVIRSCAETCRPGQDGTWISEEFIKAYLEMHDRGFAHSVEAYHDGKLAGGLYGVSLGGAFFGESMFHKENNASKVAFFNLVELAKQLEFNFIDCQVETSHLVGLGATLIPRTSYLDLLGGGNDFFWIIR